MVSVPLRGNGRETDAKFKLFTSTTYSLVSVPLRGNGRETISELILTGAYQSLGFRPLTG